MLFSIIALFFIYSILHFLYVKIQETFKFGYYYDLKKYYEESDRESKIFVQRILEELRRPDEYHRLQKLEVKNAEKAKLFYNKQRS